MSEPRNDIRNNLPPGAIVFLSKKIGVPKSYVSKILTGVRNQDNNHIQKKVIELSSKMAALNIWNEKYNTSDIKLNPFDV